MDEANVYGKFMILCVQNDLVIVISPLQFNKIFKFAVKRCFPITLNHRQRQAIDKVGLNLTVCSFIYLLFTFFHRYYPIRSVHHLFLLCWHFWAPSMRWEVFVSVFIWTGRRGLWKFISEIQSMTHSVMRLFWELLWIIRKCVRLLTLSFTLVKSVVFAKKTSHEVFPCWAWPQNMDQHRTFQCVHVNSVLNSPTLLCGTKLSLILTMFCRFSFWSRKINRNHLQLISCELFETSFILYSIIHPIEFHDWKD